MIRRQNLDRQFGRNQLANHGGNFVAAALPGWLGWCYGFGAVFALSALFGVLSIIAISMIPGGAIDHDIARGADGGVDADGETNPKPDLPPSSGGFRVLLLSRQAERARRQNPS